VYRLNPKDIVIEYVGEKIRNALADKREAYYDELGIGDCYMFRLNQNYVIDATFFGNKARYLNHSCEANCYADVFDVAGELHIILLASRVILQDEELTYNYKFEKEFKKIPCFCGSKNCARVLN
jgi:SET domain-containing protein